MMASFLKTLMASLMKTLTVGPASQRSPSFSPPSLLSLSSSDGSLCLRVQRLNPPFSALEVMLLALALLAVAKHLEGGSSENSKTSKSLEN